MPTIINILIVVFLILIVCGFIYYVFLRPRRGWYDTIPTPVIPTPISSPSTSVSTPSIIHGGDPTQSEAVAPDYTIHINNIAQTIYDIRTASEDILYDLSDLIVLPEQPSDDTIITFLIIFVWAIDHSITTFHDGIANGSFVVTNHIANTCSELFGRIREHINFREVNHYVLSIYQCNPQALNAYCAAITAFSSFIYNLASEGGDAEARLVMSIVVEHFWNIITEMVRLTINTPFTDAESMNMFISVIQSKINMLRNISKNILTSKFAIAIIYRFVTHFINFRTPDNVHTQLLDNRCLIYRFVFDIPIDVDFDSVNPLCVSLADSLTTLHYTGNDVYLSDPYIKLLAITIPAYLYSLQFDSNNVASVIAIIIVYEIIYDFKITDHVPTDEAFIIFYDNLVHIIVSTGIHKEADAAIFVSNCIAELFKLRGIDPNVLNAFVKGGDTTYRSSYLPAYNVHRSSDNDSMKYIRVMLMSWSLNSPITGQRLFRLNSIYDPFSRIADFATDDIYAAFIEHIANNCSGVIPDEFIKEAINDVPCHGNKYPNERFFSVAMMHMMNFLAGAVNITNELPIVCMSPLMLTDMLPTRKAKYKVGEQHMEILPYFVNIPYFLCKSTDKHTVTVDSQAGYSRYTTNMIKYVECIHRISEKSETQLYSCDFRNNRLTPFGNTSNEFRTLMGAVSPEELSYVIDRWKMDVGDKYTPNDMEIRMAALYPYIAAVFPHILHVYAYVWKKENSRGGSVEDKANYTLKKVGEFVPMEYFPPTYKDSAPFTTLMNITLGDMIMIAAWGASMFQQSCSSARDDGNGVYDIVLGASVDNNTLMEMRSYMYTTAMYVLKHLGTRIGLNVDYDYSNFQILSPNSYLLDDLTPATTVVTYGYCGVFPMTYGSTQLRNVTSWWAHYDPITNRDMRPGVLFLAGVMQLLLNEYLFMWIDSKTSQNKYYTSIANSGDNGRLVMMTLPGTDDTQLSMMVFDYGECDEHHLCKDLMNMLDHHLRLIARELLIVARKMFGNKDVVIWIANMMMMCIRNTLLKRTDSVGENDDGRLFTWSRVDKDGKQTDSIKLDMRNVNMSAMQFILRIIGDNSVLKDYWNHCAGVVIDDISDKYKGVRMPSSVGVGAVTVSQYVEIVGRMLVDSKYALLNNPAASEDDKLILVNVNDDLIREYAKNVIIGSFILETDVTNHVVIESFLGGTNMYEDFMNESICMVVGANDHIRVNATFELVKPDYGNALKMESKVLIPVSECDGQVNSVASNLLM